MLEPIRPLLGLLTQGRRPLRRGDRGGAPRRRHGRALHRPARRHPYPDLRADRTQDRGLHGAPHAPDGNRPGPWANPRERHGRGIHRGHSRWLLSNPVRRPEAWPLYHPDATRPADARSLIIDLTQVPHLGVTTCPGPDRPRGGPAWLPGLPGGTAVPARAAPGAPGDRGGGTTGALACRWDRGPASGRCEPTDD